MVITETVKLTPAQVMKLLKGTPVLVKTGTNVMGEKLCIEIKVKGT